jgi:hypothetical protein
MTDLKANGSNYEEIFGQASEVMENAFEDSSEDNMFKQLFDKNGELTPHFYRVDGGSYQSGKDDAHPSFRLTTVLLNSRMNKTRHVMAYNDAGLSSPDFREQLIAVAMEKGLNKTNTDVLKPLEDRAITKRIISDLVPKGGIQSKDKSLDIVSVYDAVKDATNLDDSILRLVSTVYISVLNENGYIHDFLDLKKVMVDRELAIDFERFTNVYMISHLKNDFDTLDLDMGDANLKKNFRDRVRPNIITSNLDRVFNNVVMVLRSLLDHKAYLTDALYYTTQMAQGNIENVPEEVRAGCLSLSQTWNLLEYGIKLPIGSIKPQPYRAYKAVDKLTKFLVEKNDFIQPTPISEIASFVRVDATRNLVSDEIESIIMSTDRNRVDGRDVFIKMGDLMGFDKLMTQPELQNDLDALYPSAHEAFPKEMVLRGITLAASSCDFLGRVVMDFTSLREYDRDMFAMSVAVTRSSKVTFSREGTVKQGARAEITLIYYVKPTERLYGVVTGVNLNDELRTTEPREVIMLTGATVTEPAVMEGYHAKLLLNDDAINFIDISEVTNISDINEPAYKSSIVRPGSKDQSIDLELSPLEMLRQDKIENLCCSSSITNAEDDLISYRLFLASWALLKIQKAQSQENDEDEDVPAIESAMSSLVGDAASEFILFTATSTVASHVVEDVVRIVANREGLFKGHTRLYGDERLMLQIRTYVAGILVAHFSGLTSKQVKRALNVIKDSSSENDRFFNNMLRTITKLPKA